MSELAGAGIPVTVTCRVLKLSRQPYYRWLADPITASEVVEAYRANALFDAHRDDPEFGHRLLADEARDNGEAMSDRTAWRIASSNGWFSAFGKPKRSKARRPGPAVHDDLCAVIDQGGRTRHVFAEQFRVARERLDLKQSDVLRQMQERGFEWNRNTLSSLERGQRGVSLSEALALAEIIGQPIGSLSDEKRLNVDYLASRVVRARDQAVRALAYYYGLRFDLAKNLDQLKPNTIPRKTSELVTAPENVLEIAWDAALALEHGSVFANTPKQGPFFKAAVSKR